MAEKNQSIEELKKRHAALHEKKITAQADLRNANEALEKLKQQARNDYGTDNLDDLRKKLQEMKEENERKRAEYQQHLEKIELDLKAVDQKFTV